MNVTRADAVKHLEQYLDNECYTEKHKEVVRMAIAALEGKEVPETPEPLTLEELQGMNGQPVWIAEENAWGIVAVDTCGFYEGRPFVKFRYDSIWCDYDVEKRNLHCYRCKSKSGGQLQ